MVPLRSLVIALCLVWATMAQAANYWVSTQGNNANGCINAASPQTTSALRQIQAGINCLAPGDTLHIRGGTYTQPVTWETMSGGSWSTPITVQGHAGETVIHQPTGLTAWAIRGVKYAIIRNITIDGTSGSNTLAADAYTVTSLPVTGMYRLIDVGRDGLNNGAGPLIFEQNVLRNSAYSAISANCPVPPSPGFCEALTVRNNEIYNIGKVENCIVLYFGPAGSIIEGNYIHDIMSCSVGFFGEGLTTAHDVIVRNNRMERMSVAWAPTGQNGGIRCCVPTSQCGPSACGSGACVPGGFGGISCSQRIPQGTIIAGNAIQLSSGNNQQAYNNIITEVAGAGIFTQSGSGCQIYNNTIVGNLAPQGYGGFDATQNAGITINQSGCTVRNNITYQPGVTSPAPIVNGGSGNSFGSTNMCSGGSAGGIGCTVDNPLFVGGQGAAEDFKLLAGSNANGGGVNLSSTFTTDYGGRPRPGGGNPWSMGAWAAEAPPQPNPVNLVGEWKLDAGSGTSAVNTAPSTAGSMTGTLNSAGWTLPGIIGPSDLATNGARGITITPHALMRAITDQFGISAWWRGSNAGGGSGGCILLTDGDGKYAMITTTGQLECGFWNGASFTTVTTPVAGPNLLDGNAHHASCSYQAGGDGLRARIDNVSLAQLASLLNVDYSLNPQAFIGSYVGGTPNFTCGTGTVGNVRVFDQWIDSVANTQLFEEQVPLTGVSQSQGQFVADNAAQSFLGTINTGISHVITDQLGYQVAITNNSGAQIVEHFPLFCQNSRLCDGFREVTNTIGPHGVAIATSPHVNMGDSVPVTLPPGGHTPVAGRVVADTINVGSETTLPHGAVTNWRYVLRFAAPALAGDVIECRPYREASIGAGADTMLDHYFDDLLASIPTITLTGPPSAGLRLGGTSRGGTLR